MICPEHPRYQAIHKPRCDCDRCWKGWRARHCDTNGTEIEAGQTVAYNKEGKVVMGNVIRVGEKTKYAYHEPVFEIEMLSDHAGHKRGHISKVNNSTSILVIK